MEREPLTPAEQEDLALMARVRDGDVDAFAALVARHRRPLERFLYRLFWQRELAEDGAQEVFLRLWTARRRYRPDARFTTFLYQVARNYWLDAQRKRQRRPVELPLAGDQEGIAGVPLPPAPPALDPCYQLMLRYRQHRIQQAIDRLPDGHRLVFVLCHLEGRRLAEIAEILGIPVGTVKSRLHAAIRLLRGWLGPEEEEMKL